MGFVDKECQKITIPWLRLYSTHMWKKYTTPISKGIATYAVGISQMAMPVFVIIVGIAMILLGVDAVLIYASLIPTIVYVSILLFCFRVVGRLDRVLEYESSGNCEMALVCASAIRRYINRSTAVTVFVTIAWAMFAIFA